LYGTFKEDTGSENIHRFLYWLLNRDHIDAETHQSLQSGSEAGVSDLPVACLEVEDADDGMPHIDGKLDLLGPIGKGGEGEIFAVREHDLRRTVALKRILPAAISVSDAKLRFFREVQITAQLEHPNIVPVYQMFETGGSLSYTMKLIQGRTLKRYIFESRKLRDQAQPLPEEHRLATRLEHFLKICDALAYAHGKGIIHRDLKPSNIMIGPYNEVYLMDWGVARSVARDSLPDGGLDLASSESALPSEEARSGAIVGTFSHMSPEQALGDPASLDPRSDLYGLGLVLFELVTLTRAVPGKDDALITSAQEGVRNPIEHYVSGVTIPWELRAIIDKATMIDPEDRYPTVEAFAEDIRRFLGGEAVIAAPDTPLQSAARWVRSHYETTLVIMLVMLGVLFLTVTGSLVTYTHGQETARVRADTLGSLLTSVSTQAHHIDAHFLIYEGLLQGLAAAAVQALRQEPHRQETGAQPFYLAADFSDPASSPPGVTSSARYRRNVSLDWTVFKLAPGVSLETPLDDGATIRTRLLQLAPLRHQFKQMMLSSRGPGASHLTRDEARDLIMDEGVPLVWSYVALEEGIHNSYPGKGGYPAGYDPRTRPWYQLAAHQEGPQWGSPYLDALGQGLILPCAMSLYGDEGAFRGVAGVEFTFEFVIEQLLDLPTVPGVWETYLLDEQARVVVRSGEQAQTATGTDVLELPPFPIESVARAVREGASGFDEVSHRDEPALVFYTRMEALGWTYVVVGDRDTMLHR